MKKDKAIIGVGLIFLEVSLLLLLFTLFPSGVIAGIGSPNVTVITQLEIGNVFPEVLLVEINSGAASIALSPAINTTVGCIGVLRDYNGDTDIIKANATFFDSASYNFSSPDDNNYHYSNSSCNITTEFGSYGIYTDDAYYALANCTFNVTYYANPGSWECRIEVEDTVNWLDNMSDSITISQLLALGLPDTINYGTVNATYVSNENITNVTNYGNVQVNLSLEGYGKALNDGIAMNCTLGNVGNISIEHEKYNLTASTPGPVSLSEAGLSYINLTTTPTIKRFELASRINDATNDAFKSSYWRIYVPKGVAGTCTGNIVFGATVAAGS